MFFKKVSYWSWKIKMAGAWITFTDKYFSASYGMHLLMMPNFIRIDKNCALTRNFINQSIYVHYLKMVGNMTPSSCLHNNPTLLVVRHHSWNGFFLVGITHALAPQKKNALFPCYKMTRKKQQGYHSPLIVPSQWNHRDKSQLT